MSERAVVRRAGAPGWVHHTAGDGVADTKTALERIGHADVNVTLFVYDHVFVKDDEEAAISISDHIYG